MTRYIADNGSEITEQMIDKWANEAEKIDAGKHVDNLKVTPFEGRPWEHRTHPMKARTVRLPETTWHLIDKDAHKQHITVSEWTRRAMNEALFKKRTPTA